MVKLDQYRLHMLSFENTKDGGHNIVFGNGANLQPWHLDIVEAWLAEQRAQPDGSDLV